VLGENDAIVERDLGGAVDRHMGLGRVPLGEQPARLHGHGGETLNLEALAAHVGRSGESRFGVAAHGRELGRTIGAGRFEQQNVIAARHVAVRNDG